MQERKVTSGKELAERVIKWLQTADGQQRLQISNALIELANRKRLPPWEECLPTVIEMYKARGLQIDDSAKIIAKARAHQLPDDRGFILFGVAGSGKTSRAEVYSSMECNRIRVTSAYQLMDELRVANEDKDKFADALNIPMFGSVLGDDYRTDGDLLIDGLGDEDCMQNIYGTKTNLMARAILMRYNAFKKFGCRTFFTSSLLPPWIEENYGDGIYDKLTEMCVPCLLPFESWRPKENGWELWK